MQLTFGARLRSHRERQDVALAAIADETKISVALLEGLERDDLSRWPGGLFRRAYVRTYARKIGLDPDKVLREFLAFHPDPVEETSPVEAIAQNAEASGKRPRTRIGLMLAGLARRSPRTETRRRVTPDTLSVEAHHPPLAFTDLAASTPTELPEPALELEPAIELEPANELEPVIESHITDEASLRLTMIPLSDPGAVERRELRDLERNVVSAARLCTRISRARDDRDLSSTLEEAVVVLEAEGAILWVWDADRDALFPALAHGYSDELLSRLPDVRRCADNAIAAAFRCGQKQVVRGTAVATGALVVPLMTPHGCAGVLALEYSDETEQHELVQALAAIIAAQFSTLFAAAPEAAENDDWAQQDRSLVAS